MNHSAAASSLLKDSEGCKLKAYPDPASGGDPWTIGWGSTGPAIKRGVTWTQAMADTDLEARLNRLDMQLTSALGSAKTTQGQFDAMIDFAYNAGLPALLQSTLFKKHRKGDFAGARAEFHKWVHASGHVMSGLVKRRAKEADLYGA